MDKDLFQISKHLATPLAELSVDDLETFAELHKDSDTDENVNLYMYSSLLLFESHGSTKHLEHAVGKLQRWIKVSADHQDRYRRERMLDVMSEAMQPRAVGGASKNQGAGSEPVNSKDRPLAIHPQSVRTDGLPKNEAPDPIGENEHTDLHTRIATLKDAFEQTGIMDQILEAMRLAQEATSRMLGQDPAHSLNNLFALPIPKLEARGERDKGSDDPNRLVSSAEEVLASTSPENEEYELALSRLAIALSERFLLTDSEADLDRLIEVADMLANPKGTTELSLDRLECPVVYPNARSDDSKDKRLEDLTRAIDTTAAMAIFKLRRNGAVIVRRSKELAVFMSRMIMQLQTVGNLTSTADTVDTVKGRLNQIGKAKWNDILATLLEWRFEIGHFPQDLDRAIEATEKAADVASTRGTYQGPFFCHLARLRALRFKKYESKHDLDRAIIALKVSLESTHGPSVPQIDRLSRLGKYSFWRYESTKSLDDLNVAIDALQSCSDASSSEARTQLLSDFSASAGKMENWFWKSDEIGVLVHSLDSLVPWLDEKHGDELHCLAVVLHLRYEHVKSLNDLHLAADRIREALRATMKQDQELKHFQRHCLLGKILHERSQLTHSLEDLHEAAASLEAAYLVCQTSALGPSAGYEIASELADCQGSLYEFTGDLFHIAMAIDHSISACELALTDKSEQSRALAKLGSLYAARAAKIRSIADANSGVETMQLAVSISPPGDSVTYSRKDMLAVAFAQRFWLSGSESDLNLSIQTSRDAVVGLKAELLGFAHNTLAWSLGLRFSLHESMEDINDAIESLRIASASFEKGAPERIILGGHLGVTLLMRSKKNQSSADLDEAIDRLTMVVENTPETHPMRGAFVDAFAKALLYRAKGLGKTLKEDMDKLHDLCKKESKNQHLSCQDRVSMIVRHSDLHVNQKDWKSAAGYAVHAVNQLVHGTHGTFNPQDAQELVAQFAGVPSTAASMAVKAGVKAYEALKVLEHGRGVIAGTMLQMRGDLSDLRNEHPVLADRLDSLREELEPIMAPRPPALSESLDIGSHARKMKGKENYNLDRGLGEAKLRLLLDEIRSKPGFEWFLAFPKEEHMKAAAHDGPLIVINLCPVGAEALIVQADEIRCLSLPQLSVQEVKTKTETLRRARSTSSQDDMYPILEWLWDAVCFPILEFLKFQEPCSENLNDWPHVWWIPTGRLAAFPFHAAGYHRRGAGETVIDRVISSYASSIKTMIDTRRRRPQPSVAPDSLGLLLSMPETPRHNRLPFAEQEVALLKDLWPKLGLQVTTPANELKDDVLKHLQDCQVFHFAGHGHANPTDPSKSALLLKDWETDPFTVGDLRNENLHAKQPFLAYLSACSTATVNAIALVDEAIHPISILQLAGFRHAVGTLWEVSDPHCVDVARVLYETLRDFGLTDKAVCLGLHKAVRALRDREVEVEGGEIEVKGREVEVEESEVEVEGSEVEAEENGSRKGRLKLEAPASQKKAKLGAYWIPYVHFGV